MKQILSGVLLFIATIQFSLRAHALPIYDINVTDQLSPSDALSNIDKIFISVGEEFPDEVNRINNKLMLRWYGKQLHLQAEHLFYRPQFNLTEHFAIITKYMHAPQPAVRYLAMKTLSALDFRQPVNASFVTLFKPSVIANLASAPTLSSELISATVEMIDKCKNEEFDEALKHFVENNYITVIAPENAPLLFQFYFDHHWKLPEQLFEFGLDSRDPFFRSLTLQTLAATPNKKSLGVIKKFLFERTPTEGEVKAIGRALNDWPSNLVEKLIPQAKSEMHLVARKLLFEYFANKTNIKSKNISDFMTTFTYEAWWLDNEESKPYLQNGLHFLSQNRNEDSIALLFFSSIGNFKVQPFIFGLST